MDIQLYVYDLSRGLARTMSRAYLGIQIDAVYHTSLVFNNTEYFFGAGIQTSIPGTTHHGRPMEIIPLGRTDLPLDIVLEYLESMKEVYKPESYDLFAHNCNNFTHDFALFLIGRGIPDHITSLPRRVLDTPFGQMLRPQLDASMRTVTQAPVPAKAEGTPAAGKGSGGAGQRTPVGAREGTANGVASAMAYGSAVNVTALGELERYLKGASETASTIFFTSSTCAPCKLAYPMFDRLAEQYPDALFVKVDINAAHDIAARYAIRATPTFMTFSRGAKVDEWAGADPNLLKANVDRLINDTSPPHHHSQLSVPTLQHGSLRPVTYAKIPPLDKLVGKLGDAAKDPHLTSLKSFVAARNSDARNAPLPDNLKTIATSFPNTLLNLPIEIRFAALDLLRCAMLDPRVSGYFAADAPSTIPSLIRHVNDLEGSACPHSLRLVALHLACNLFTSPLYTRQLTHPESSSELPALIVQLVTASLLDATHPSVRVAAAWLAFNLASTTYRVRREETREGLDEGLQVEVAASVLETLGTEENEEAVRALLLALGYLVYFAPVGGEVADLCRALDANATVNGIKVKGVEKLAKEVATLL